MSARGWTSRVLLAVAGFGLVGYLVHGAGPGRVAQVLWGAGPWLPAILALELVQLGSDVLALRLLLKSAAVRIPAATWVRSSAVAYAMMVLLPAGRAAGEVARASLIAKHVGTPTAATASMQLSAAYLSAIGLASLAACATVTRWLGLRSPLSLLLAANTLLMALSTGTLVATARDARLGRWLEKMRRRFLRTDSAASRDLGPRRGLPWRAALVCWTGRAAQWVQYGVILTSVGGRTTVQGTFVTHGIHLIGATLGDLLPNQLGVVDGAYRTFAPTLGLADAPERALSIAFVAHAVQLTVASACLVVATVTRQIPAPQAGAPTSADAGARS